MIQGVLAMLKSGLLIAQRGFEQNQSFVSPLMAAALNLSEALAEEGLRKLDLGGKKIYVVSSPINPDLVVAVASDAEDPSIELRARELLSKIAEIIPQGIEIVTDDMQRKVQRLLEDFIRRKHIEMPYFDAVIDIAKIIYGNLPPDVISRVEEHIDNFITNEEKDEEKRIHKPRIISISSPRDALSEILKNLYSWDLLPAFDVAYSLAKTNSEEKILGALLAIKIGLLTRRMPPNHLTVAQDIIRELMEEVKDRSDLLTKFVILEALGTLEERRGEWTHFLQSQMDALINLLNSTESELLREIYAFLLFSTSRYVLYSPLGERLLKILGEKSRYLKEYLSSLYELYDLFQILYTTKNWSEIEKELARIKTSYLEVRKRFQEILSKKFVILRMLNRERILELSFYTLSRILPYLLVNMAAVESYGLSIRDRHLILQESYQMAVDDAYDILRIMPPLESRAYFNFYQLILHVLYYLTLFATRKEAEELWKHILKIAREGLLFFARLWARKRISNYGFLSLISPIIFTLAKAAWHLNEESIELLSYVRHIAFVSPEVKEEVNRNRERHRPLYLNTLMAFLPVIQYIQIPGTRERILREILEISDQIGERDIVRKEVTREFIDDLADTVIACIEYSSDKNLCKYGLQMLKKYATVLIRDMKESTFEAAIAFERLGESCVKFLNKFGDDEVVKKLALIALENARKIWLHEGYSEKVKEIDELIREIQK